MHGIRGHRLVYREVVEILSGVSLHTLNFLHSSLSVIQQEMFKKIVLVGNLVISLSNISKIESNWFDFN